MKLLSDFLLLLHSCNLHANIIFYEDGEIFVNGQLIKKYTDLSPSEFFCHLGYWRILHDISEDELPITVALMSRSVITSRAI
ncbi:MAG: hypothetical protein AAF741_10280 [Bacteroidota bacterium]